MSYTANYKKIKKEFPTLEITDLQGYGVNIHLDDRIITAYWKKRKWGDNRTGTWNKYKDVDDLIVIVHVIMANDAEDIDEDLERGEANHVKNEVVVPSMDNGVQKCIDHLLAKAERVANLRGTDNASVVILKVTAQELYQYLP